MSLELLWQRWTGPYLLLLVRCSGLVALSPVLGSQSLPRTAKAGLAAALALLLTPLAGARLGPFPLHPVALTATLLGELAVGAALGLSLRILFGGISMAGELAAVQMGIGLPAALDPHSLLRLSAVASLLDQLGVVVFLIVGGHHALLAALVQSVSLAPPLSVALTGSALGYLVGLQQAALLLAVRLAAPVSAAMLACLVTLGLLNRMAPQVNVFMVSFALSIGLGLLALLAALPFIGGVLEGTFRGLPAALAMLIGRLSHGL